MSEPAILNPFFAVEESAEDAASRLASWFMRLLPNPPKAYEVQTRDEILANFQVRICVERERCARVCEAMGAIEAAEEIRKPVVQP